MNLTPEQLQELVRCPEPLRALIRAELAAGNTIIEVGHSHPAPPAGAYFKLANKVSTCERSSSSLLDFYERQSSSHSGEFTDANRLYFVLEPPNPPPPELDMDAIRQSLERKSELLSPIAPRTEANPVKMHQTHPSSVVTETTKGRTYLLYFRDSRPPRDVARGLEQMLATRLAPSLEEGRLKWHTLVTFNGVNYELELRFLAAVSGDHWYSFRTCASWPEVHAAVVNHYRRISSEWFQMWTSEWTASDAPPEDAAMTDLYQRLVKSALQSEAPADSVVSIQQTILALMKRGGRFGISHKEGGTHLYWQVDRFVRSSYGDFQETASYSDESAFLRMLRQFYDFELRYRAGKPALSELEVWKDILRLLLPK